MKEGIKTKDSKYYFELIDLIKSEKMQYLFKTNDDNYTSIYKIGDYKITYIENFQNISSNSVFGIDIKVSGFSEVYIEKNNENLTSYFEYSELYDIVNKCKNK